MTSADTDTFAKSARKSVVVTALLHAIATGTGQCIICAASACIIAGEVSGTKNGAVLSATHFGKSLRQEARTASNLDCGTPLGLSAVSARHALVAPSTPIPSPPPTPSPT